MKPWILGGLVSLLGFLVSYQQSILMVSLLYSIPLLVPLNIPTSSIFWQLFPLTFFIVLVRFVPFFLGIIIASGRRKTNLSTIALAGTVYELLRAGILQTSWERVIPKLTILVERAGRTYYWVDAEVAGSVLQRLYPIPIRVLAAAMLTVLGAMIVQTDAARGRHLPRWVWVLLAIVVVIMAT